MSALKLLSCLLILMINGQIYAQEFSDSSGYFEVIQDQRIDQLIQKHIEFNEKYKIIVGYRVQIFFDSGNNSKKAAMDIRAQFLASYPDISAYIIWEDPHFKVRVGDFRTKIEAEGFLARILPEYPGAFVTRDNINYPELD